MSDRHKLVAYSFALQMFALESPEDKLADMANRIRNGLDCEDLLRPFLVEADKATSFIMQQYNYKGTLN